MDYRGRSAEELIQKAISAGRHLPMNGPLEGYNFSQEYLNRMEILGERFKNIKWLPLDIPKIELDSYSEFLDIWAYHSHDVVRVKPDVAEPWSKETHPWKDQSSWHVGQFNGLHLYHHPNIPIESNTFASKMYTGKIPLFERIVDQVNTYFPIHTLISVFIWESKMAIAPHRDRSAYWQCPTEFRSMLHDENDEPTLYVVDGEKPLFIDLPKDTNSFCWSNGQHLHGSTHYGKRKFILCIAMVQHSKKSEELFERSILKYKDKLNYKLDYDIK